MCDTVEVVFATVDEVILGYQVLKTQFVPFANMNLRALTDGTYCVVIKLPEHPDQECLYETIESMFAGTNYISLRYGEYEWIRSTYQSQT